MGFYGLLFFGFALGAVLFTLVNVINGRLNKNIPLVMTNVIVGVLVILGGVVYGNMQDGWVGMAVLIVGSGILLSIVLPLIFKLSSKKSVSSN